MVPSLNYNQPIIIFLRSRLLNVQLNFYIYIYAFSRRFYPKRFTVYSGYTFFCQYVCSLGIEPTTFYAAYAMLYHWATGTHFPLWNQSLSLKLPLLLTREVILYYHHSWFIWQLIDWTLYMAPPLTVTNHKQNNCVFLQVCAMFVNKVTVLEPEWIIM